jgi:dTDP-4-amino-4,6-dideoxygalactose transaminase
VIPFVDLRAQYRTIGPEVLDAARLVLESGHYVLGPEVAAFDEEFAAYCQTQHAISVNTGTSALHLALLALGVGPGDEVITVPFTFVATVAAIGYTGARPVFVDVEPSTLTMDPAQLEAGISERTKAIVPVHLYGQTADMQPILEIARRHGVAVVEDACQAHGAEHRGIRAGSIGDIGCFSFYPGKNLGAYGEGGAVTTSDPDLARKVRVLRDWGTEQKYVHAEKGFNYRLPELQAAFLRVKLRRLEEWTEARRAHARLYDQLLSESLQTPVEQPGNRHVYHLYAVRVADREAVRQRLHAAEVQTGIHYPVPVHLQPAWSDLGHGRGDFPVSERAADEVLSLPMYAELADDAIGEVAAELLQTRDGRVAYPGSDADRMVGALEERLAPGRL